MDPNNNKLLYVRYGNWVNILYQKLSELFSIFFIEEYQYRSTFFAIDIFWQLQFLKHFIY